MGIMSRVLGPVWSAGREGFGGRWKRTGRAPGTALGTALGRGPGTTPGRARAPGLLLAFAVALLPVLGACESLSDLGPAGGDEPVPVDELPRELSEEEVEVVRGSADFGLQLLERLAERAPEETHFVSPFSASMALGMTLMGAGGTTFNAMASTLGLSGLSEEEIGQAYRALLELLEELDPAVSLQVANAVWHGAEFTADPDFRARVEEEFGGTVEGLDFSDEEEAARRINDWVADATEGRIEELVTLPLPPGLVAYLTNAVHFQAGWTEPFDPEETREAPFHLPDGSTVPVRLMARTGEMPVAVEPSYKAVELPYGGGAFSMTVVVPREGEELRDVLSDLAGGGWSHLVDSLEEGRARVYLPRFQVEWDGVLNEALEDLGMGEAFTPAADFGRMLQGANPWIDEVKQKTFLRVDEEGTEAAGATSVAMIQSMPPTVRADRPFLLALRERHSGTLLFAGVVVEAPEDPED